MALAQSPPGCCCCCCCAAVRPSLLRRRPRWAYLGGIPGALTVVVAAITVNSPLALAGSLALMLTGQVLFGMLSDSRGWFGVIQRRLRTNDIIATLLILAGCALLIFLR